MASQAAVAEMLQRSLQMMEQGRVAGMVCAVGGVPVAYGQVTRWPRTAEISDLIVSPAHRNQGIGSALIHALTEVARGWGCPQVEIGSACANTRAIALYERLGFRVDRRLNLDLGQGPEPVIYLVQPLP